MLAGSWKAADKAGRRHDAQQHHRHEQDELTPKTEILECDGTVYVEPLKIFPAEQFVVVEQVGGGGVEDALTEVATEGVHSEEEVVVTRADASITTLTNMCTTPGNAGSGFGYAWSFGGAEAGRDNSQGDMSGNIGYAVNNNVNISRSRESVDCRYWRIFDGGQRDNELQLHLYRSV